MRPLDPNALQAMTARAAAELADCHDRGEQIHYRDIADAAVRFYVDGVRVPLSLGPAERDAYAHEIVRRLIAMDSRR